MNTSPDLVLAADSAARPKAELELLRTGLSDVLARTFPEQSKLHLDYLCKPKPCADDTTKLLIYNKHSERLAVVLLASSVEPKLVKQGIDKALAIKSQLSPELGNVILTPKANGWLDGRSYTILPYCKPLGTGRLLTRMHNFTLRPLVVDWLTRVTQATVTTPNSAEVQSHFVDHLRRLAAMPVIAQSVKEAALHALRGIEAGRWQPRHVMMHGDLWRENILFSNPDTRDGSERYSRLVVIDWPGSLLKGYPIYDLIRLSVSMSMPKFFLVRHLKQHCEILDCTLAETRDHLVSALAYLSQNLGHFPISNYARLAHRCIERINSCLPGSS